MNESQKIAIGRIVIRSKQQLCALRPIGEALGLSTMLFGDEVLSPDRIDELDALGEAEASKREITMAQQLIDSLSAEFDPSKFKDDYRERVLELIEKKAAGEEIAVQPEAEDDRARPPTSWPHSRRASPRFAPAPPTRSRSPRSARRPSHAAAPGSRHRSRSRSPTSSGSAASARQVQELTERVR